MNEEADRASSCVQTWARRTITISGCIIIWLLLLIAFPVLLLAGAVIDFARGRPFVITRCVFFFLFYFTCEVIGVIASFLIWLASGLWIGASHRRFLDWNFALQRWWRVRFVARHNESLT
jgi:hypothetical protein